MPIIYEVTLTINANIANEYDIWLTRHIADMLTLPGFLDAKTFIIDDGNLADNEVGRVIHYRLKDRAALDAYFHDHATGMRDSGIKRFGDQVRADRRTLMAKRENIDRPLTGLQ